MSENPDLAHLRAVVSDFRAQAAQVTRDAHAMRDQLAQERKELERERRESEEATREARKRGELSEEQERLMRRVERGETSWRAVMTGEDEDPSARIFRADFAQSAGEAVEALREIDPEFREVHDAALRAQGPTS